MNPKMFKASLYNEDSENNSSFSTYHLFLPNTISHTHKENKQKLYHGDRKWVDKILKSLLMAQKKRTEGGWMRSWKN